MSLIVACLVFVLRLTTNVNGELASCVNNTKYWIIVEDCLVSSLNTTGVASRDYIEDNSTEADAQIICQAFQLSYECIQSALSLCEDEDIIDESVSGSTKAEITKVDAIFLVDGMMKATEYFCMEDYLKMTGFIKEDNLQCAIRAYQNTTWPQKLTSLDEGSYLVDLGAYEATTPATTTMVTTDANSTANDTAGSGQTSTEAGAAGQDSGVFDGLKFSKVGDGGLPRRVCGDLRRQKQAYIASLLQQRCNGIEVNDPVAQAVEAFLEHTCSQGVSTLLSTTNVGLLIALHFSIMMALGLLL